MTLHDARGLRALERWLADSAEEAERLLPTLLALPSPELLREFDARPELRTPGMMQCLLRVARESVGHLPLRAHELTSVVLRYAGTMAVPPGLSAVMRIVEGEAWREHANVLLALCRRGPAQEALTTARALFSTVAAGAWYSATIDLLEAPLLHGQGRRDEALAMIRGAVHQFALFRDDGNFLQARMLEVAMMRDAGDGDAAEALWCETVAAAERRGHTGLLGRVAAQLGVLALRHDDDPAQAMELLNRAVELLGDAGLEDEVTRALWHLAEAMAACGRNGEAIFQFYRVRAALLRRGSLFDAAIAGVSVLELLLPAGRDDQLAAAARTLLLELRDAGMTMNALEALAYLSAHADAGCLTQDDLDDVRRYYEDLPQSPLARFLTIR